MPKKRKYISWRQTGNQEGWIVQYRGSTWGGFHPSLKKANLALKQARAYHGDAVPVVVKNTQKGAKKQHYYGISYHKVIKRYVGNACPLGRTFETAKEAFMQLCKVLGLPATKMPGPNHRFMAPQKMLFRIRRLIKWGESHADQQWLPADLEATYQHCSRPQTKAMYNAEPSLECASLSLKYLPWKDALVEAWQLMKRPKTKSLSLSQRAKVVAQVLKKTAELIAKAPVEKSWPLNCNRSRHREQGPAIFLKTLGIIQKKKPQHDKAAQKVKFSINAIGEDGEMVEDLTGQQSANPASKMPRLNKKVQKQNNKTTKGKKKPAKTKQANPFWHILSKTSFPDKIQAYIAQFDAIKTAVGAAPHSIADWHAKMSAGMNSGEGAPYLNGKYMRSWHIRSYLLSCMHRAGVGTLTVDNETSLNAYLHMNPDAKGNMQRLRSHFEMSSKQCRGITVKQFLKLCHAKRPELLSMWCCLAMDSGFQDSDFTRYNDAKWQKASQDYYAASKVMPHPAVTNLEFTSSLTFLFNAAMHIKLYFVTITCSEVIALLLRPTKEELVAKL